MKTLSEALQIQIIEQAGTTFRSVVMAQLKDDYTKASCVVDAHKITQFFIELMVRNLKSIEEHDQTSTIDFVNIKGVQNGS